MEIDKLPTEMLMHIFTYLPTYKNVSLVNRRFYEVACELNYKNVSLTLDHRLLHLSDNLLQSIEKSYRKISQVDIHLCDLTEEDLSPLLSIISRFSATIKYLRIEGDYFEEAFNEMNFVAFFIKILSLVPNAEYLSFRELRLSRPVEMSSNEDLNLKHLRILELLHCQEQFQVLFNRLPAGTITELQVRGGNLLNLNTFFSRQTNIKKLSLDSCRSDAQLTAHILNNLELESLEIMNLEIGTAPLSKQKKLKSATLTDNYPIVGNHVMNIIANSFTELEELEWEITETPVNDFTNIIRLKKLKHLRLQFSSHRQCILDKLIELDNSQMFTLEISDLHHLTDHQIQKLATSAPTLKVLKVFSRLSSEQTIAVLKYFNFVECLVFFKEEHYERRFSRPLFLQENYEHYLNQSECVNPKLTELSISIFQFRPRVLRKMFVDYPNIKKLTIKSVNSLTSSHFRLILNGLTKLELLELYRSGKLLLTIDDFKYLRDNIKRLKIFWLRDIRDTYVDRHLEDLEAIFEVVKYSRRCQSLLLKM